MQRFDSMKSEVRSYRKSLRSVAERLDNVARSLRSNGLEEQAQSIETTVADLDWQCEEFDSDLDGASRSE